jgi:3-dehydro-L-gulonate 2-dehydrogenase
MDPRKISGRDMANQIADSVVEYVNGSELAEGEKEVLYPGQSALRTRNHQREHGIEVDDGVWAEVQALA